MPTLTNCTRCDGTGFLNIEQVDEENLKYFDETGDHQIILDWMEKYDGEHDVAECDCCDGSGQHDYDTEKTFNCM